MKICYLADIRSIHTKRWVEYFAKEYEVSRTHFFDNQGTFIDGDE